MKRPFISALLVLLASLTVFGTVLARATLSAPINDTYAPSELVPASQPRFVASTSDDVPVALRIPAAHVDANVQHVGLSWTGKIGVPNNYTDVAWYKYGPLPGAYGSAVMDGHVDNGFSFPAVFNELDQVRPGDEIVVVTAGGRELTFTVEDTHVYALHEVPIDQLFTRTDAQRLTLITCSGTWLDRDKTYDRRLVVYAVFSHS